jgi:4-hydroxybenzoate polyprenyltransferase
MWKTLFVVLAIASVIMFLLGVYLGFSNVYLSASLLCVGAIVLFPALQALYAHSMRTLIDRRTFGLKYMTIKSMGQQAAPLIKDVGVQHA